MLTLILPEATKAIGPAAPLAPLASVVIVPTVMLVELVFTALLTNCTNPPLVPEVFIAPVTRVAALPVLPVQTVTEPPIPPPVDDVLMLPKFTPVTPLTITFPPLAAFVVNVTVLVVTEPVAVRNSAPPFVDRLLVAVMLLVEPVVLK